MARRVALGAAVVKRVHAAVDAVFEKAKARLLGGKYGPKRVVIAYQPRHTLPDLFESAAAEERAKVDDSLVQALARTAAEYLDSQKSATRARVVEAIESFVNDARARGSAADLDRVLAGQLVDVWRRAKDSMSLIADTEATKARNLGSLEGIVRVNASQGIDDPVVFFLVVRDDDLCKECRRLHLLEDGFTPRVWRLSECAHGYHRKGDAAPSLRGEHPHCRCTLVTLMPGYGFDGAGKVRFVSLDHDEIKRQRG